MIDVIFLVFLRFSENNRFVDIFEIILNLGYDYCYEKNK